MSNDELITEEEDIIIKIKINYLENNFSIYNKK